MITMAAGLMWMVTSQAQPVLSSRPNYHLEASEFRALQMRDENGSIPASALLIAAQQKQRMPIDARAWPGSGGNGASNDLEPRTAGVNSSSWTPLGPDSFYAGRIRSILINPTNPSTMWIGSVSGGIWKTLNGGASWFALNDFMANLAIGCLVMDPTNPNVIYAGTGEGYGNFDAFRGAGVFKTTDGGATWAQLTSTATSSFYYVNRLTISPTNNQIILAAIGNGIWRSTDGGNTWSQRYNAMGIVDILFNPKDGSRCIGSGGTYGTAGAALYSIDGGMSWNDAAGISTAGRIELAYAPSSPNKVYASANNNSGEVYISNDGGATYSLASTGYNYLGDQGWYGNSIWVDPTNPNILVVGGLDLWRSIDGGTTFTDIGGYSGGIHADLHAIVNSPSFNGSNIRTVFVGTDGGIFRTSDLYTASPTGDWMNLNTNLGITQFYGAAGNNSSGTIIGGAQDNGTLQYTPQSGNNGWRSMFDGDGGFCASDPTDTNYFYGEYIYLQIRRSTDGGNNSGYIFTGIGDAGLPAGANFIAPFILDPNNANTILAGGSNLWRSVNAKAPAPSWSNIKTGIGSFISAIAVAQGSSDIVWVGYNNGNVYSAIDGTALTPSWVRKDQGTPNLPRRMCTRLVIDSNDWNRVYATFGGFSADNVYRTTNSGVTWANIAMGLPSVPIRSLVIAPFNNNFLYVGTEIGVFASDDGGTTWSPGNEGAANVSVDELLWMGDSLIAATHGRGLFKIRITPGPIIKIVSSTLAAESCPPGNGTIDPGETVVVNLTLTNIVSLATSNLIATLLASNGVVSPGLPQSYGALMAGGVAVTRAFTFTASGQCGGVVTFTVQLTDGTNNLGLVSSSFPLGAPRVALSQNFDAVTPPALPSGWLTSWTGVAGQPWVTTNGLSDSSPNSVFIPDAADISDDSLTSPSFTVNTTNAQLTFRHNYNADAPNFDGGVLEISIGGGIFSDILAAGGAFVTNGYTDVIYTGFDNPLSGRAAWCGSSGGFITTKATLPAAAAGQAVRLRWRFGSDNDAAAPGWFVDTISVNDSVCCTGSIPLTISSITRATNSLLLKWTSLSGLAYRVQFNTNLLTTNWADVSGDVLATSSTASKNVTNGAKSAFYRVKRLP